MARIIADFGRQRVIREGRVIYALVYRLDCGCSMEADERELMLNQDHRMLVSEAANMHRCGIVFTPKVYDVIRGERPTPFHWARPPIGVMEPIGQISTPERMLREFYSEPRPARPPVGFHPDQLKGLSGISIVVDEAADCPKPKPEPKDRFDLIEID